MFSEDSVLKLVQKMYEKYSKSGDLSYHHSVVTRGHLSVKLSNTRASIDLSFRAQKRS